MRPFINNLLFVTCLALMAACSQVPVAPTNPVTVITKEPVSASDINSLAAASPDTSDIDPVVLQHYQRALALMTAGKYDAAEKIFAQIIESHSDLAGPFINLGIIYLQSNRTADAEHAFKQAVERNPGNTIAYNQLGILYRKTGRFNEAQQMYKKALEIDPFYANAHLNLGILYDLYLNEPELALVQYKRYQELNPADDAQVKLVKLWVEDINIRLNQTSGQPGPK